MSALAPSPEVAIGNEAGWALSFHREAADGVEDKPVLMCGSEEYDAEIQAALPSGLDGGVYRFTIEGMTLEDHAKIAQSSPGKPTVVRLYLYWRDAAPELVTLVRNLSQLTDSGAEARQEALRPALVAELAVISVARLLGQRRYETTIVARERAFEHLRRRLPAPVNEQTLSAAAQAVGRAASIAVVAAGFTRDGSLPPRSGYSAPDERTTKNALTICSTALAELAESVELYTGLHGRGMTLIRNGVVVFGPRAIPLPGTQSKDLTLHGGLIEVQAAADATTDPNADPSSGTSRQFTLLLKGRPDLRPGDLVRFDVPSEEAPSSTADEIASNTTAALDPLAGEQMAHATTLYVNSVEHRLGRQTAFSTTLTGVVVDPKQPWDVRVAAASQPPSTDSGNNGTAAHPAVEAANAFRDLARNVVDTVQQPEVAEVRTSHGSADGSGGTAGQTVDVYRGLAPPDGLPNQARRLPVRRENPTPVNGVATATAFAWGKCGLVVPRYPGTRIVLVHRNGNGDDPVDVGAVWESGHGPDSQPGDWWLTLPVGVAGDRSSVPDGQTPVEHTGKVSNDLIDGDGRRVIQLAGLTVSVGPSSLTDAGARPTVPDDAVVTIENADAGARLTIDADGTITIHAAKDLVLEAPGGDIKLTANNVDVSVDGSMDVH